MHYRGDEVRPQRVGEEHRVLQISGDERSPAHRRVVAATQIVVDDRLVSGSGQRLAGVWLPTYPAPPVTRIFPRLAAWANLRLSELNRLLRRTCARLS